MTSEKKRLLKNYREGKRMGYITKDDVILMYSKGYIPESEYNHEIKRLSKKQKHLSHALNY